MIWGTVEIEKDFFVYRISPSPLDGCLDIHSCVLTRVKEGTERNTAAFHARIKRYTPALAGGKFFEGNQWYSPPCCFHCGNLFSIVLSTGKQNSGLPHWQNI